MYVPGAVEPMLPHALSSDACSLRPGVERFTVTAELEIEGGRRVGASFYRSKIRSDDDSTTTGCSASWTARSEPRSRGAHRSRSRVWSRPRFATARARGGLAVETPSRNSTLTMAVT